MKDNISAFNATEYDGKIKCTIPYYEEFYRQVIDVVRNYSSEELTWLDVGCGTGKMAREAFHELNIRKFVFCDSSEEMIKSTKQEFACQNAEFLISDIQELNYTDAFDVVTAIQVNHYFPGKKRAKAYAKCHKALKPGGIFINFENFEPQDSACEELYLKRWKEYQRNQGKSDQECEEHVSRYKREYFPIPVTEQQRLMKECGFRSAELLWLSYMQAGILGIK